MPCAFLESFGSQSLPSWALGQIGDLEESGGTSIDLLLTGGFFVLLLLALVAIWVVFVKTKQGLEERERQMGAAEQAFEKAMLRQMGLSDTAEEEGWIAIDQPVSGTASPAAPLFASPEPPAPPPPQASAPGRFDAAPKDLEELIRRLTTLQVIGDLEGRVALPVPPEAPIYRLRKGGLVVLLPRMESEATMAHLAKRFDMVLAMTGGGDVLVVSRLQSRLVELMENPGDFDPNLGFLMGRPS